MPNSFYNTTSFPATGSAATSASMRAELARIAAGFDKLPALAGNANKIVVVNLGATGLDVLAAPAGDLVGTSATQTLTGKSISMASNTLTGTLAQFNTALTDADFATLAGVETLTNKTISGGAINGTPIGAGAASTGAFSSISVSGAASLGGNTTLSAGSANGVAYLNGSKVLTTGSALTFDGTNLTLAGYGRSTGTGWQVVNNGIVSTYGANATGTLISNDGNDPIQFQISGGEQMRLTSTGLGIGTSSVQSALNIEKNTTANTVATAASIVLSNRNGTPGTFMSGGIFSNTYRDITDTNYTAGIWFEKQNSGFSGTLSSRGAIVFGTQDSNEFGQIPTERMRLDAAGNLGLGVTPSAWQAGRPTLEIGGATQPTIAFNGNTTNGGCIWTNAFYDGVNRYKANGPATRIQTGGGLIEFYTAPSGTAGSPITFTHVMSLTGEGNLLVGTTSNLGGVTARQALQQGSNSYVQTLQVNGSSGNAVLFQTVGTGGVGTITLTASTTAYNTSSDYRLKNITGPITNSGVYIDSLNPVEGTWKADGSTFVGLIAHEVQEASRTPVATGTKDGEQMQGMDYSSAEIIANLIAEVQSLRKRLAAAGI